MAHTIIRNCRRCGKQFSPHRANIAQGCGWFCTALCFRESVSPGYGSTRQRLLARRRIDPQTGCWNWTGWSDDAGYGGMSVNGKKGKVSRIAAQEFLGFDPLSGLCVLHHCDNPGCFNPEHLFIGTRTDNMKDMVRKQRGARGENIPQSKLTTRQVLEIRRRNAVGETNNTLAAAFNVVQSTISRIVQRKRWMHV